MRLPVQCSKTILRRAAGAILAAGLTIAFPSTGLPATAAAPVLSIVQDAGGVPSLSAGAASGEVLIVERSSRIPGPGWTEWLRTHGPLEGAADFTAVSGPQQFYRALVRSRTTTDDWKNVVHGEASEAFLSEADPAFDSGSRWIKFVILLEEPDRIYFQDSTRYAFHYDFAVARLPAFKGLGHAAFDAVTQRLEGQRAVLGAVLFPPPSSPMEIGIQFVGLDPYPREWVAQWFANVRARIEAPPGTATYYLPAFEQAEVARQNSDWFAGRGVRVSQAGRWAVGDECYARGWALGRLVEVPGTGIAEAYRAGRLRPDDILLTDAVPAEVPPLAGILSLLPATPNSHVALLSQSFGIPFVYLATPALAAAVRTWTNQDVMIRAAPQFAGCDLTVERIDGVVPPEVRTNILALRAPRPVSLPPKARRGAISVPVEDLHPADVVYVGGKAANFGILRRRLPSNSPSPARAFTFDLWDAYLDQPVAGGVALRTAIRERLAGFAWPPDMAGLQAALDEVRGWITDGADFTAAQRAEIVEALRVAGFDGTRNIRFRSSTNVEDNEAFSGAGLHDSYSGCLADDLDGDRDGPSACDPTEPNERGVFRALRKVFASFYNDNAYLERLRHAVDEGTVGMAVLAHPSVPDEFELANGVATMRVNRDGGRYLNGEMVTQAGAVSVTNPDSTAVPETVVFAQQSGTRAFLSVGRRSSLVPLGGMVMAWDTDYRSLFTLLNQAALGYEAEFPAKRTLTLDFEYKRLAPDGRLQVKQVREVPQPRAVTYTPWLLNVLGAYEVFQGERGDVISKHRLKSDWRLATRALRLDDAGLSSSPLARIEFAAHEGTNVFAQAGSPDSLPGHVYLRGPDVVTDRWRIGEGGSQRDYELRIHRIRETGSDDGPMLVLGDHEIELAVEYGTAQVSLAYDPVADGLRPVKLTNETARLASVRPVSAGSQRQERSFKAGRVQVETAFWWPPPPTGPTEGYTAPVQLWIETRITGLASRPIVLRHPWSQTYQPGHHNFYEEYLFEPRLDPEVPADLLAELAAANVKAVIVGDPRGDFGTPVALVWGLDDTFRPL